MCCLGAIKNQNRLVVVCVLQLCDVALAAYGGGGAGSTLPHSPNVTLHAHHMPDLPSIASSSISKQSGNTHKLLEMGCCASAKGLPLLCPLVGFEGVCLCRLCLLKTHWLKGFALRFALRGALWGALRGFICPIYGSVLLSSTGNNKFLCAFCANTYEELTYIVASVLLTVCGNLGPHQSKALCVTRDMHGKDMPFPSRPFLSSRTSACVNNAQRCCRHSSKKSAKGF